MKRRIPRSELIAELENWCRVNGEKMPDVRHCETWVIAVDLIDRGAPDWYFQMACEDHEMPSLKLVD